MNKTATYTKRSHGGYWEFFYHGFLRVLALFFIFFAIQSWMQAIGLWGDLRFDTMPIHWRLAVAALCVLNPVTALGLWGLFSWGIAVWLINVVVQLSMYLVFSNLFAFDQTVVVFHFTTLAIFVIFQLALRFTNNKS